MDEAERDNICEAFIEYIELMRLRHNGGLKSRINSL
jgi:hypothetical protein